MLGNANRVTAVHYRANTRELQFATFAEWVQTVWSVSSNPRSLSNTKVDVSQCIIDQTLPQSQFIGKLKFLKVIFFNQACLNSFLKGLKSIPGKRKLSRKQPTPRQPKRFLQPENRNADTLGHHHTQTPTGNPFHTSAFFRNCSMASSHGYSSTSHSPQLTSLPPPPPLWCRPPLPPALPLPPPPPFQPFFTNQVSPMAVHIWVVGMLQVGVMD